VAGGAPVVAETPVNHEFARARLLDLRDKLGVPFVEVSLRADLAVLRRRVRTRGADPGAHAIQAHFAVTAADPLLEHEFVPVLEHDDVLTVDTNDLTAIDIPTIAAAVRGLLAGNARTHR
jgi:predicted kinase